MRVGKKAVTEKLERRRLLSVTFTTSSGLLAVNATATNDHVTFTRSGTTIKVVDAGNNSSYATTSVKSITATLGSGTDSVSIDSGITVPASLTAGAGPDTLVGGGGHNTFYFGAAAATGAAAEYVIAPGLSGAALDFSGLPAADTLTVDLTSDAQLASFGVKTVQTMAPGQSALFTMVTGAPGNTKITANSAADSLVGGAGSTTLVAGSGADTLVGTGSATDYVFNEQALPTTYTLNQAKAGQNQLDFSALIADDSLTVNLNYDVMAAYDNVVVRDAKAGQYLNFNYIDDGAGDDVLTANKNGNTIIGGSGDDYIYGGAGADLILVGDGLDFVSGEGGADTILGGAGFDTIFATNNTSDPLYFPSSLTATSKTVVPGVQIYAGDGDCSIVGGLGDDTLIGGGGNCTIHGMGGDDYIVGGSGNSVLFGDEGNDTIYGGEGDNTISGGDGENVIYGGTVGGTNTFIDKNLPDNTATAAQGDVLDTNALTNNAIAAAQGIGTVTYPMVGTTGPGDIVLGGSANTTVIGGIGDETLSGGDGQSTLVAGPGADLLTAGYGSDVLQGGAGEDTLAAGGGPDSMTGGLGNSTFLNLNGYADTVIGGAGFNDAQADPTGLSTFSNIQIIYSPTYTDSVGLPEQEEVATFHAALKAAVISPAALTSPPSATVSGTTLHVGSSSYAGVQNYSISESGGLIFVTQPSGVQQFAASSIALVSCLGGAGADFFNLSSLAVTASVNAGNGNNTVIGGSARDTLTTGSGNDIIYGGYSTNVISGGGGDNILYGGPSSDSITGGSGDDWIYPFGPEATRYGDTESDTITGGSGTEKVGLSGNGDPMNIRLDKGTITDDATGVVTKIKGVRNIWAGVGNDTIVGGTAGGELLVGGSGNDSIYGISASNVIDGGPGNDTMFLDGNNGFMDLYGTHATTPGNVDYYNAGKTILTALVDATDHLTALQHQPG